MWPKRQVQTIFLALICEILLSPSAHAQDEDNIDITSQSLLALSELAQTSDSISAWPSQKDWLLEQVGRLSIEDKGHAFPRTLPDYGLTNPLFSETLLVTRGDNDTSLQRLSQFSIGEAAAVPLVSNTSFIIKLKNDLTTDQIQELFQRYNFVLVEAFEQLNSVHVSYDARRFFFNDAFDASPNERIFRGVASAVSELIEHPYIELAVPDTISFQNNPELLTPLSVSELVTQQLDWGISDIQADAIWGLDGAQDGTVVGVLDSGFSPHEDITFLGANRKLLRSDHGNHVAGILCGKHNDKGVAGVVPSCFVAAYSQEFEEADYVNDNGELSLIGWATYFSQIASNFNKILRDEDGARVYNISLGYNWRPNFNLNPDEDKNTSIRELIESNGIFMRDVILPEAEEKGKVVYSAAGNDSDGLDPAIGSEFSSIFNWAAINARKLENPTFSGVVVEAHDMQGNRAAFSNVNGDLSCPGVGILSAVAHSDDNEPSDNNYAYISGTSMASPYCAGAHALFALVRPKYTHQEIIECLKASGESNSSGTPMVKLEVSLEVCPKR